jgi:DNA-binding HxlR family transcriptional regulator
MSTHRDGYREGCAVAHGLELIGERWTLLIVRELLLGPKRFNALQAGILHASANILSQRLHQMEQAGIVQRRRLGAPANAWAWELTSWGQELEPIVMAIGLWAKSSPSANRDGWFSPDALMLHVKARLDHGAKPPRGRLQVRIGDDRYSLSTQEVPVTLRRGEMECPDAAVEADLATLTAVIKGRKPFDQEVTDGNFAIHGDHAMARRLLTDA